MMRTFLTLLLFLTLRPAFAADAVSGKAFDIPDLMAKCESNFDVYQSQLRLVRSQLRKEIGAMTEDEYKAAYIHNDPRIIFQSLYWPRDLEAKDKSWGVFDFCSKQNWETLKALGDSIVDKSEKAKKTQLVKSCIYVTYYKKRLVFPLNQLVACYENKAVTELRSTSFGHQFEIDANETEFFLGIVNLKRAASSNLKRAITRRLDQIRREHGN